MRKEPPEYFEARKAVNQHLHRHHNGAAGNGTLADRLTQHEELHLLCERNDVIMSHVHSDYPEAETDIEAAHRILREGNDGQTNISEGSGSAGTLDRRKAKRRR